MKVGRSKVYSLPDFDMGNNDGDQQGEAGELFASALLQMKAKVWSRVIKSPKIKFVPSLNQAIFTVLYKKFLNLKNFFLSSASS
jgi:hypothetical protein